MAAAPPVHAVNQASASIRVTATVVSWCDAVSLSTQPGGVMPVAYPGADLTQWVSVQCGTPGNLAGVTAAAPLATAVIAAAAPSPIAGKVAAGWPAGTSLRLARPSGTGGPPVLLVEF